MKRITSHHLRVHDLEALSGFYGDLLGMQELGRNRDSRTFGFDANHCCVAFHRTGGRPYEAHSNDFYWKIGITLGNLDAAIAALRTRGLAVPDPHQFRDIGYMTKITDPNGFIIELLQQGFEGNCKPMPAGHPIGAQSTLAHITLRVTDIAAARSYFEKALAMRLMSVQPVEEYGFCLYFYSWSEEPLPDPDLTSVGNREWLWRRPYAFIELQHLARPGATVHKTEMDRCGFDGFSYLGNPDEDPVFVAESDLNHLS